MGAIGALSRVCGAPLRGAFRAAHAAPQPGRKSEFMRVGSPTAAGAKMCFRRRLIAAPRPWPLQSPRRSAIFRQKISDRINPKQPAMIPPRGAAKHTSDARTQETDAQGAPARAKAPPRSLTHAEVHSVFVGLMLAAFLAALNQTVIATALPTIGRHFADFENLSWVVTAYLLTSTAVAPLYGKLSDIYGRRAMMLAGVGVFMAGSAACAAAPDMALLIAGRALQGLGGGGILPLAQAIIADVVAPRERGRYQAYMGAVWVSAGVGGPVLGGALAEHLHWSLIFWLNVPLGLIAAFACQKYLKLLPPRAPARARSARRRPDDGLRRGVAAGAELGRHALRLAFARHSGADRRLVCAFTRLRLAACARARRFCRLPCLAIRSCAWARSPPHAPWQARSG